MKRIKLLVDAHVFDQGFQGTTSFIEGIYNSLVKNPELEIYLAANDPENLQQFFPDERFRFIPLRTTNKFRRLLLDLPAIIRKYKIDAAHFQYIVPPIKFCRYIVTIHDLLFKDFPSEFPLRYRQQKDLLFRNAASQGDILTTVSSYSREALSKHYGISKDRIVLTPNAVGHYFFEMHDKAQSAKYIASKFGFREYLLYVARLEPRKNHHMLIRAFRELRLHEKGIELVLAGSKSIATPLFDAELDQLSAEEKKHIHQIKNIAAPDLLHLYNAARLFVYPSKAEGFGIPPLEAAALRTPVLCSQATAMADYDFFGSNLFDPSNEEVFQQKLLRCLNLPAPPAETAAIANIIRERYNWDHAAAHLSQAIMSSVPA